MSVSASSSSSSASSSSNSSNSTNELIYIYRVGGSYNIKPPKKTMPKNCTQYLAWIAEAAALYVRDQKKYFEEYDETGNATTSESRGGYSRDQLVKDGVKFISESYAEDPSQWYWKIEAVARAVLSPQIKTISFVPTNPLESQTYFIEKLGGRGRLFFPDDGATFNGYLKPHAKSYDRNSHEVDHYGYPAVLESQSDVDSSLEYDLDTQEKRDSAKPVLEAFLQDPKTQMISLTFVDGSTHVWTHGHSKKTTEADEKKA